MPALANEVGKSGTLAATPVTFHWPSHRLEGKMPTLLDPPLARHLRRQSIADRIRIKAAPKGTGWDEFRVLKARPMRRKNRSSPLHGAVRMSEPGCLSLDDGTFCGHAAAMHRLQYPNDGQRRLAGLDVVDVQPKIP